MRATRATRATPPLLIAGLLAATVVALVGVVGGAWPYTILGNADPGPLVRVGTPVLRLLADASATMTIGALAFGALFAGPKRDGLLAGSGRAALRTAGRAATAWAALAVALIPFDVADQTGQALTGPPAGAVSSAGATTWQLWSALETPIALLVTAWLALGIAIACRMLRRWRPLLAVFCVALLAVLPALATGHASAESGHDIATAAILVHVPLALLWLGVLVALTRARWRTGLPASEVAVRYRRLAGWCWFGLAGSGLVLAAVLAPVSSSSGRSYGSLLLVKAGAVAALGLIGVTGRRALVRRPAAGAGRAAIGRLALAELVLLGATMGISVGLTHLPPPAFLGPPATPEQTLLGYDLTAAPGALTVLLHWRFDPLFASVAVLLAALYVLGARRIRRAGRSWPPGRTVSWCLGCCVLLIATNSGIARYASAMFSFEVVTHMLLAMLAPFLLVLGSPATLAAEAPRRGDTRWGPPQWCEGLRGASILSLLTHPLVAFGLFVAAPFLLYGTGLFDAAVRFHWAMLLIDAVFLVIGYLFALVTVGLDPVPRPLPALGRAGLLLAAMPCGVVFGALLIGTRTVIGDGRAAADFYSALALPWVPDLLADQRLGGVLTLVLGEGCLLLALVALLRRWHRFDGVDDDTTAAELALAVRSARAATRSGP
jgi:putative copper resistance protein D